MSPQACLNPMFVTTQRVCNVKPLYYGNTGCGVFKRGGTKLERFLPKNQHTQRKLLNFENWISRGLRSFQKSEFSSQKKIPQLKSWLNFDALD